MLAQIKGQRRAHRHLITSIQREPDTARNAETHLPIAAFASIQLAGHKEQLPA